MKLAAAVEEIKRMAREEERSAILENLIRMKADIESTRTSLRLIGHTSTSADFTIQVGVATVECVELLVKMRSARDVDSTVE